MTSRVTQHPEQRLDIDQGLSLYLVKDRKTKVEKRPKGMSLKHPLTEARAK